MEKVIISGSDNLHCPDQVVDDWKLALQFLREGNERFYNNRVMKRDTNEHDRNILKNEQKPFAVIVTCSDSRVSPEIYFDQKLGDIFVIRNAGNIADATALGSIEFAVEQVQAPLVVVVGHSKCSAVTVAFGQIKETGKQDRGQSKDNRGDHPANLQSILDSIGSGIKDANSIDRAIENNIHNTVRQIKENVSVQDSGAKVLGAFYNIKTGEVTWLP